MTTERSTPGATGYLLAVAVSIAVTSLGISLVTLTEGGLLQAGAAFVVCLVYVAIFAIPTAPLGVLLLHLSCRRVRRQSVHVLAAGALGVLTGIAFGLLVDVGSSILETWSLTAILGIATATGRAVVIALVPDVRARRRPVDDDFVPGGSAC